MNTEIKINGIRETLATKTVENAVKSMLYEVVTNPKPGLVDPLDSGPHPDMDAYDFLDSSVVLAPYLKKCFNAGWAFKRLELKQLFEQIRPLGINAEQVMFNATNNVNTHKGAIFSLGVLVSATGYWYARNEGDLVISQISQIVRLMLRGLTTSDFAGISGRAESNLTAGQRQFLLYGETGIRGEAEKGYPTVTKVGLPFLRKVTGTRNQRLLDTLMIIVSESKDSNLIKRAGNTDIVKWAHQEATQFLNLGGSKSDSGMKKLMELNQQFLEQNLSLGGSADLLILTIFLSLMEGSL